VAKIREIRRNLGEIRLTKLELNVTEQISRLQTELFFHNFDSQNLVNIPCDLP
jgi:hypothetical protein